MADKHARPAEGRAEFPPPYHKNSGGEEAHMGQARNLCRAEKKELRVLADDFRLLDRADVQEVIKTCRSYEEGQREIMRIYTAVYLK